MVKYKCKKCKEVSTEKDWNQNTEDYLDTKDIMGIKQGLKDTAYGCSYTCPGCGDYVNIKDIERVT